MPLLLRRIGAGIGVVLLQWLVFGRLGLWGVVPDVVLLFVALVAIKRGRLAGAVAGFSAGLVMDILTNPTMFGLNALVKTLMGFVVGLFRSDQGENTRINPPQALVGALVVGVVQNGLMTILLALDQNTRTPFLIAGLWLGGAVYTAVVAFVAALFSAPRGR
ncbi:MAG TPA: rod shape-determining protein MreD [Rubricoccaceae bacterium]|jgi:rod shape-determining protein MreD